MATIHQWDVDHADYGVVVGWATSRTKASKDMHEFLRTHKAKCGEHVLSRREVPTSVAGLVEWLNKHVRTGPKGGV